MQGLKPIFTAVICCCANFFTLANSLSNRDIIKTPDLYFTTTPSATITIFDSVTRSSAISSVKDITVVGALNKGFFIDAKSNSVMVFNLKTNTIFNKINTGDKPVAIFYDAFDEKIITCNQAGKSISVIDPVTEKLITNIGVGGVPETVTSDDAGRLFVSVKNNNEIVLINLKKRYVEKHWSALAADEISGLAFDPITKRLFAACSKPQFLLIFDTVSGELVQRLPISGEYKSIAFDAGKKIVLLTDTNGNCTVVKQQSTNNYRIKFIDGPQINGVSYFVDEISHKIILSPLATTQAAAVH